ncbi:hypothetical protein AMATHDRAFT_58451 [Amanita thiersii Skay4041]|uniref:F-box domain-containing protein n=1 Tax=Amanita thiersii Skay4041 TaxID=703135 RepID=A0A2A9NTT5_9AGAR|nr:hypothetical protein AMATHDRAFT_58451 [Amanita thiersii Skay4041]
MALHDLTNNHDTSMNMNSAPNGIHAVSPLSSGSPLPLPLPPGWKRQQQHQQQQLQPRPRRVHTDDVLYLPMKMTSFNNGSGGPGTSLGTIFANPKECEELAYRLLAALPRSRLASVQRRIAPLLQFDIVSSLPTELALQILVFLPHRSVLTCAFVCRRWKTLADDQTLWKRFCHARGWEWRAPVRPNQNITALAAENAVSLDDGDDEGMGDSDEEEHDVRGDEDGEESITEGNSTTLLNDDSGFESLASTSTSRIEGKPPALSIQVPQTFPSVGSMTDASTNAIASRPTRSAPATFKAHQLPFSRPNYKLLYQTHLRLQTRFLRSSYKLTLLQDRETPSNGHTNMIYCLQLYTYPSTGRQVLFTGSRDKTVKEWDLETRKVVHVIEGVHTSSVLSICAHKGYLASAGSDRCVALWDLEKNTLVKVICDHEDSVLCVRFDDERLVTCSKDRTVRTYSFPDLVPQFVLGAHRAAVNAVSIYKTLIVSGSGDRSIRLWDAQTGRLLRTFDEHHTRGIASIDFKPPYILSGSSDKHLRLFDMTTLQGWFTSPETTQTTPAPPVINISVSGSSTTSASSNVSETTENGLNGGSFPVPAEFMLGAFGSNMFWDDDEEVDEVDAARGTRGEQHPCTCAASSSRSHARSQTCANLVCHDCGSSNVRVAPLGWATNTVRGLTMGIGRIFGHLSSRSQVPVVRGGTGAVCTLCGVAAAASGGVPGNGVGASVGSARRRLGVEHKDLVRSVALGERFVVSGSYDRTIKVWDRRSGALIADLTGGHVGRVFCVGFDRTKIVSCGEDHSICIWDFSHGMDTSFIELS